MSKLWGIYCCEGVGTGGDFLGFGFRRLGSRVFEEARKRHANPNKSRVHMPLNVQFLPL